jgi:hypothetical protein
LVVGDGYFRAYETAFTAPESMSYQVSARGEYCPESPCEILIAVDGAEFGNVTQYAGNCGAWANETYTRFTPFPVTETFHDDSPLVFVTGQNDEPSESATENGRTSESLVRETGEVATGEVSNVRETNPVGSSSSEVMQVETFWESYSSLVIVISVSGVVVIAVVIAIVIAIYRRSKSKKWTGCFQEML